MNYWLESFGTMWAVVSDAIPEGQIVAEFSTRRAAMDFLVTKQN